MTRRTASMMRGATVAAAAFASAWLLVSTMVMAGMRGALGSDPYASRLLVWQIGNLGVVGVLQAVAVYAMTRRTDTNREERTEISAPVLRSVAPSGWQRIARSIGASLSLTVGMAIVIALFHWL